MHISPFTAYLPDLNKISFDDSFYNKLREDFHQLFKKDFFIKTTQPYYFLIEIIDEGWSSTGLIAMTDIRDYLNKKILKHEQTIVKKEKLHLKLFASRKAMIKPVALLINSNSSLQKLIVKLKQDSSPVIKVNYPDIQTQHKIWLIDQPKSIQKLTELFKEKIHRAIIADGHHRFATLADLYNKSHRSGHQQILTAYFTKDQMRVSGFYRIVQKLKSSSHSSILESIKKHSVSWTSVNHIEEKKGFIHLLIDQELFRFKLKPSFNLPLPLIFSKKILGPVFQIHNETKSKRIVYAESTNHLYTAPELTETYPGKYIFILPPLTAQEVLNNKKLLPPKSTFFLPRVINGLVVALDS